MNTRVTHFKRIVLTLIDFLEMQVTSFFSLMKFIHLFNQALLGGEITVLA